MFLLRSVGLQSSLLRIKSNGWMDGWMDELGGGSWAWLLLSIESFFGLGPVDFRMFMYMII